MSQADLTRPELTRPEMSRRGVMGGLLLAGTAMVTGCGFQPVYGPSGAAAEGLGGITVGLMPERAGQLLRQALQARFEGSGGGIARRYDLTVAYSVASDAIGIQQDSSISRIRLIGTASWTLSAQDTQRSTLATGTARSVDGYNILDQQYFASDLENESVQRRIAEAVADQLTLQLALYFKRHASKTG